MVDEIVTRQELIDAKRDAQDLGKAVNEKVIVSPRYGEDFKSLPMIAEEFQDAIETAAAAGAGSNGWTDLLIQTEDGSTQRAKNASFQAQIDQKATAAYLDNALTEQTQTVNTALSQLSTAANKFYPTLAAANGDIANITVNQPVTVGESANGGLWYKATAGATSLTKSPYDPVEAAKLDATTKANAAEANAKNYTDNATEPKLLSGLDIYYKAQENPSTLFQAIWQEYNKPVWYIGNTTFVDMTGAKLKLYEQELLFTIKLTEANQTFVYPTRSSGTQIIDANIDWGDGTTTNHTDYAINHTYTGAIGDEFQIKLKGVMPDFDFSATNGSRRTSRLMLKSIDKNTMPAMTNFSIDGCENIKSLGQGAFSSFAGTTLKIMYIPDWSNVTLHKDAFLGLSQVTNIDNLFGNNADLVIPSGLFDPFVNVTSASNLFYGYKKTSLPTGIFDKMVNLENVSYMFFSSLLTSIDNRIFKNQTKLKNVSQCFRLSSTLVADAYQLYTDMNQGSPTTVNGCFLNANAMTNLVSVPAGWKA